MPLCWSLHCNLFLIIIITLFHLRMLHLPSPAPSPLTSLRMILRCASPSVPSEPTLRQQLMADWIGTPSEQVLKRADDINYSKLVTSHCCQRQCLMHFDVDFLRACRIWYLRMTQWESRKWLSNMMENQPAHGKQYFVTNEVAHLLLFTSLSA